MTATARRLPFDTLPQAIAVFPLEGAMLLPRSKLPLNIFEPRYLAMIDDALRSEHRLIGMIQPRAEGDPPPLYPVGCAGRIINFGETEDGRYLIALHGVSRFRIEQELDGFTPFRRVQPDWRPYSGDLKAPAHSLPDAERVSFLELLRRYFDAAELSVDWSALAKADDETMVNTLAMLCPFSTQEKQALLEAPDLTERKSTLKTLMQFAVAAPDGGGEMQ